MGISDKAELFLQRIKTEGNDLTTKPNLLKGGDVVWIFSEGTYEDISAVSSALHEIFGEEFTKATELGSGYNKSPIAELLRLNEVIRETFLRGGAEDVSSAYKALHGAFGDEFTTATELGSVYNRSPIAELLRLNEVIRETFAKGGAEDVSSAYQALHGAFGEEFTKVTELGYGYNRSPIAELLRLNEVIRETFAKGGAEDVSSAYQALHQAFGDEFTNATELGAGYNKSPIAELLRLNEVIRETFAKGGAEDVSSAYQALHGAFGDEFTKATELGAGYNKSSIGKLLHDNQQIQDALSSPETDPCPILCGAGFDFKDVMKAGLHDDHQEHFCDLVGTMHAHSE